MPATTAAFEPLRHCRGAGRVDGISGLLPLVTPQAAQTAPLWFGMALPDHVDTRFGPCTLRHASLQSVAIGPHLRVAGHIGQAAFGVSLPRHALGAMLAGAGIAHAGPLGDGLIRALLMEHLFGPVIGVIEAACTRHITLHSVTETDGVGVAGLPLHLGFGAGLQVTAFVDMAFADLVALLPPPVARPVAAQARLPLRLCAGAMWVRAGQLAQWQKGDVILFAAGKPPGDALLCMAGGTVARVRPDGAALRLLTPFQRPQTPTIERNDTMAQLAATLDDVDLMVSFDLGQRSMTLAELGQLSVGSLFEIGSFTDDQVKIRANGTVIGAARLVEIDDKLGVQIVSLQPDHA